jgi:hypothetical protein
LNLFLWCIVHGRLDAETHVALLLEKLGRAFGSQRFVSVLVLDPL